MFPKIKPDWKLSPQDAIIAQRDLRSLVQFEALDLANVHSVAGIDLSFHKPGDGSEVACGVVVVLSFPGLEVLEQVIVDAPVTFPYIPGLLSFREGPAILEALNRLNIIPDALVFDGQGMAHPRRFGIASHLGVLLDCPSVGCAKSILVGKADALPAEVSATADLLDDGEVIGRLLRTRRGSRPLVVSVGHKVDLDSAVELVKACCRGYRLPEPTRLAHKLAGNRQQKETQRSH